MSKLIGIALLTAMFFAGCSTSSSSPLASPAALTSEAAANFEPRRVNSIVIAGLEQDDENRIATAELTKRLIQAFAVGTTLEILNVSSPEQTAAAMEEIAQTRGPQRTRAAELGRRMAAQGVLYGRINRYDESDGGKYGASSPANVSFSLWLISPQSRRVLWSASYYVREQPLTENLLRVPQALDRGLAYRGSRNAIEAGFREAAAALESLRKGGAA